MWQKMGILHHVGDNVGLQKRVRPEKRVRFQCREPAPTKKCGECGYRGIPLKDDRGRTMHQCHQCGKHECSHCVRLMFPILCELCRISYMLLGQYRCT